MTTPDGWRPLWWTAFTTISTFLVGNFLVVHEALAGGRLEVLGAGVSLILGSPIPTVIDRQIRK